MSVLYEIHAADAGQRPNGIFAVQEAEPGGLELAAAGPFGGFARRIAPDGEEWSWGGPYAPSPALAVQAVLRSFRGASVIYVDRNAPGRCGTGVMRAVGAALWIEWDVAGLCSPVELSELGGGQPRFEVVGADCSMSRAGELAIALEDKGLDFHAFVSGRDGDRAGKVIPLWPQSGPGAGADSRHGRAADDGGGRGAADSRVVPFAAPRRGSGPHPEGRDDDGGPAASPPPF